MNLRPAKLHQYETILIGTGFTACCPIPIYAQFQAGDTFLGGGLGFSQRTEERVPSVFGGITDVTSFTLDASPRFGYLLSERFAIGLTLGYSYDGRRQEGSTDFSGRIEERSHEHVFSPQPFLRYYLPLSEGFGFLFDLQTGLAFGSAKQEASSMGPLPFNRSDASSIFGFSAGLRPGLYYFFGRHFAMELTLGGIVYDMLRTEEEGSSDDAVTEQAFSTAFSTRGMNLQVGFNYFLNRAE